MSEIDDTRDRVYQLENLVFELPNLMNVRLDGIESHIRTFRLTVDNSTARLAQVEKAMGFVQVEMRDLRINVMIQVRLQNERLADVESQLKTHGERLDRVEQRLNGVEQRLDRVEQHLVGVEQRLGTIETLLRSIAKKLDV